MGSWDFHPYVYTRVRKVVWVNVCLQLWFPEGASLNTCTGSMEGLP